MSTPSSDTPAIGTPTGTPSSSWGSAFGSPVSGFSASAAASTVGWKQQLPYRDRPAPRSYGRGRYGVDKYDSLDNTRYAWTRIVPALVSFALLFLSLATPSRAQNRYCEPMDTVTPLYGFCQPSVDVEGENPWGSKWNTNALMMEQVINGIVVGSVQSVPGQFFSVGGSSFVVNGGSVTATGSMTASSFSGSGINLTGGVVNIKSYGVKGDGTTDDTVKIKAARDSGNPLYWPAGNYVITSSIVVQNVSNLNWWGEFGKTVIVNKAPAGNPTLSLVDTQHFRISGISIAGQAGFPNEGIFVGSNGGQSTAFGRFDHMVLQANGNAIELQKTNSLVFDNVQVWPSGGTGSGASRDTNARVHSLYVSSSVSGNYANEIAVLNSNLVGIDTAAANASEVYMNAALGSLDNDLFVNNEMEGLQRSFDITNASVLTIRDNFVENSTMVFTGSRSVLIQNNYNPEIVVSSGGENVMLDMEAMVALGASYYILNNCQNCGARDSSFEALIDSGTGSMFSNVQVLTQKTDTILIGNTPLILNGSVVVGTTTVQTTKFAVNGSAQFGTFGSTTTILATGSLILAPVSNAIILQSGSSTIGINWQDSTSASKEIFTVQNNVDQGSLDLYNNGVSAVHIDAGGANYINGQTFAVGNAPTVSTITTSGSLFMAAQSSITLSGAAGYITSSSSITASAFFGDASHLTGITATTNANLTGPVTSVGNATTIVGPIPQSVVNLSTVTTQFNAVTASTTSIYSALNSTGAALTVLQTNVAASTTTLGTVKASTGACTLPLVAYQLNASSVTCIQPSNVTGNAATVTTNANLTGDVTSVGNATTAAATQANIATLSRSGGVTISGGALIAGSTFTASGALQMAYGAPVYGGSGAQSPSPMLYGDANGTTLRNTNNGSVGVKIMSYAGSTNAYFSDGGNVGVGNASPTYEVDIKHATGAATVLRLESTNTASTDDDILTMLTDGSRNFSMGLSQSTGHFTMTGGAASLSGNISIDVEPISGRVGVGGVSGSAGNALAVYGTITSSTTMGSVSCTAGTGTLSTTATDQHGKIVAGTLATACTLTFGTVWPKTPDCLCATNANLTVYPSAVSTTALTCTGSGVLTGDTITYICSGAP